MEKTLLIISFHLKIASLLPSCPRDLMYVCLWSVYQGELERLLVLLKSSESLSEEQLAGLCLHMDDFRAALSGVQPSAKREGFATVPDVTWDDVGALHDIRDELTMAILVRPDYA